MLQVDWKGEQLGSFTFSGLETCVVRGVLLQGFLGKVGETCSQGIRRTARPQEARTTLLPGLRGSAACAVLLPIPLQAALLLPRAEVHPLSAASRLGSAPREEGFGWQPVLIQCGASSPLTPFGQVSDAALLPGL